METSNNKIDSQKVFETLKNSNWYYEHCGDRIKSGDMDEYINEIEDNLSLGVVESALYSYETEITRIYDEDGDINQFAAKFIADSVAHQLVDCVYPTVTFLV